MNLQMFKHLYVYGCIVYVFRQVLIFIDRGEIGWDGMDWINLAQDRDQWMVLVNTVMNLRVP
jgi:hypothetical protein